MISLWALAHQCTAFYHGVNEIQYDKMLYIDVQVPRYEENVRGEEMKKLGSDIISILSKKLIIRYVHP